jgi:hypothetical protein
MKNLKLWSSIITAGLIFTACGNGSATSYTYKVTVRNMTYAQPMSPIAVSYHNQGENLFRTGQAVSVGFEKLAEGGSNSDLLSELKANVNVNVSVGGNALILPSKTDTVMITGTQSPCISLASMLVNTNDAFIGINCMDVSTLAVGEKSIHKVPAYDAGTELNVELATSIPGPAGGGEGFNATRDDTNFVFIHPNVVTKDDGLATSALTQAHKWDNPAATITIERIQ